MSNLKAIALLDETISKLTEARDEMKARHYATVAALAAFEKETARPGVALKHMVEAFCSFLKLPR
jgi:hypothetical protein